MPCSKTIYSKFELLTIVTLYPYSATGAEGKIAYGAMPLALAFLLLTSGREKEILKGSATSGGALF